MFKSFYVLAKFLSRMFLTLARLQTCFGSGISQDLSISLHLSAEMAASGSIWQHQQLLPSIQNHGAAIAWSSLTIASLSSAIPPWMYNHASPWPCTTYVAPMYHPCATHVPPMYHQCTTTLILLPVLLCSWSQLRLGNARDVMWCSSRRKHHESCSAPETTGAGDILHRFNIKHHKSKFEEIEVIEIY